MKVKELRELLESLTDDTEIYVRKPQPPGDVEPAKVLLVVAHRGRGDANTGVLIERVS